LFIWKRPTKADDIGMEDMNLAAVDVIGNQCSILPNKENEIPFWVNCNDSVLLITKLRTNFNIHVSIQFLHVHNMLQTLVISTIAFKYP
jgi:hypothetical protein